MNLNLIVICIDSLRQDHVSYYNPDSPVETPNFDKFARRSLAFTNIYPEALPTIPVRTQLMTGQRTLTNRPWQPLTPTDRTITELLNSYGYRSALVTDTYHYFKPGYNFHRGFRVWRWIRGQEYDPYRSGSPKRFRLDEHINERFPDQWNSLVRACLENLDPLESTNDFYCAKVVRESIDWLDSNKDHDRLFLWVDSFDPHEPWHPPAEFDRYTDPDYEGKRYILPPGGRAADYFTEKEIAHIRGLYAGEVSYVDHYIGKLLDYMEEEGFFQNSIILLISDHGHPLADHGKFLKGPDRMYNELLKVPLLLHLPGGEPDGQKLDTLGLFHDIPATLLDALGLGADLDAFQGRSLMPVIRGETDAIRDAIVTGFHEGVDRCIRDKRWSYILRPPGESNELYDLIADPKEQNNLIDERPEEAHRLASQFGAAFGAGAVGGGTQRHFMDQLMHRYEVEGSAASQR